MKFLDVWLMVSIIIVTMSLALSVLDQEHELLPLTNSESNQEGEEFSSFLQRVGRSLLSHHHHHQSHKKMTCNKFPRVCWKKGSPGKDCCQKKCVNVQTDRRNCGWCGHRCKYSEICCKGKCLNPKWDKKNCGGCTIKCKKGRKCQYGMCSYA